jgi:hypothetical protein
MVETLPETRLGHQRILERFDVQPGFSLLNRVRSIFADRSGGRSFDRADGEAI